MNFTGLEYWPEGAAPGAVGTGSMWRDGDLGYRVEVRGNTFLRAGGDAGTVTGAFFGPEHEGMGGGLGERTGDGSCPNGAQWWRLSVALRW